MPTLTSCNELGSVSVMLMLGVCSLFAVTWLAAPDSVLQCCGPDIPLPS